MLCARDGVTSTWAFERLLFSGPHSQRPVIQTLDRAIILLPSRRIQSQFLRVHRNMTASCPGRSQNRAGSRGLKADVMQPYDSELLVHQPSILQTPP
jgi:hypothetical protein